MSKILKAGVVAALALGGLVAVASPAAATEPCSSSASSPRKSASTLKSRPDNGNHGVWALDTLTRTVTISVALRPATGAWSYHADVVDKGAFVTQAGAANSPREGLAVTGGRNGTTDGHFTADFTAEACFANFKDTYGGKEYSGTAPTETSNWVKGLWGGDDFHGTAINDDWTWTYRTCVEKWVDAANNNDGADPDAGDIRGGACPVPSPSAAPVVQPSTSSSAQPIPVAHNPGGGLPVTGTNSLTLAGIGLLFVVIGLTGIAVSRRRRHHATSPN